MQEVKRSSPDDLADYKMILDDPYLVNKIILNWDKRMIANPNIDLESVKNEWQKELEEEIKLRQEFKNELDFSKYEEYSEIVKKTW